MGSVCGVLGVVVVFWSSMEGAGLFRSCGYLAGTRGDTRRHVYGE